MKNKSIIIFLMIFTFSFLFFGCLKKNEIQFIHNEQTVLTINSNGKEKIKIPEISTSGEFKGWYLDQGIWSNKVDENSFINTKINKTIKIYSYVIYPEKEDPEGPEEDVKLVLKKLDINYIVKTLAFNSSIGPQLNAFSYIPYREYLEAGNKVNINKADILDIEDGNNLYSIFSLQNVQQNAYGLFVSRYSQGKLKSTVSLFSTANLIYYNEENVRQTTGHPGWHEKNYQIKMTNGEISKYMFENISNIESWNGVWMGVLENQVEREILNYSNQYNINLNYGDQIVINKNINPDFDEIFEKSFEYFEIDENIVASVISMFESNEYFYQIIAMRNKQKDLNVILKAKIDSNANKVYLEVIFSNKYYFNYSELELDSIFGTNFEISNNVEIITYYVIENRVSIEKIRKMFSSHKLGWQNFENKFLITKDIESLDIESFSEFEIYMKPDLEKQSSENLIYVIPVEHNYVDISTGMYVSYLSFNSSLSIDFSNYNYTEGVYNKILELEPLNEDNKVKLTYYLVKQGSSYIIIERELENNVIIRENLIHYKGDINSNSLNNKFADDSILEQGLFEGLFLSNKLKFEPDLYKITYFDEDLQNNEKFFLVIKGTAFDSNNKYLRLNINNKNIDVDIYEYLKTGKDNISEKLAKTGYILTSIYDSYGNEVIEIDNEENSINFDLMYIFKSILMSEKLKFNVNYERSEFKLKFYHNLGTNYTNEDVSLNQSENTLYYLQSLTFASIEDIEGASFKYWSEDGVNETTLAFMPNRDVNLYAVWNFTNYTITYETDGGALVNEINTYKISDTFNLPKQVLKDGYRFLGWYLDDQFEEPITSVAKSVGNIEVYAEWIQSHSINYNLDSYSTNNINNPKDYVDGDGIINLAKPTKNGYKFLGWYNSNEYLGNKINTLEDISEDINIYPLFLEAFSIVYHLFNGVNDPLNDEFFAKDAKDIIILKAPAKYGYKFLGWYNNSDYLEVNQIYQINGVEQSEDEINLYAKWEKIDLIDSYEIRDENNIKKQIASIGDYVYFGYYPQSKQVWGVNVIYDSSSDTYFGSDGYKYVFAGENYFKVEEIKWQIIDIDSSGHAQLVTDNILFFDEFISISDIRVLLNNTIYNSIFNNSQKDLIATTLVDNSSSTTVNINNEILFPKTNDKVFLLSYVEMKQKLINKNLNYSEYLLSVYDEIISSLPKFYWSRSPVDIIDEETGQFITVFVPFVSEEEPEFYTYKSQNGYSGSILPSIRIDIKENLESKSIVYVTNNQKQTFNENSSVIYSFQEELELLPLTSYGYKFLGWFNQLNGGDEITSINYSNINEEITLYARWEEIEIINTYKIIKSEENLLEGYGEVNDYMLFGYLPQSLKEEGIYISPSSYNNIKKYYIGSDGNYYVASQEYFEEIIYTLVEPIKWLISDIDLEGNATITRDGEEDLIINIINDIRQNKITYELNGGIAGSNDNVSYILHFLDDIELIPVVKQGYKFLGWYLNGTKVDFIEFDIDEENLTFVANWEKVDLEEEYKIFDFISEEVKQKARPGDYIEFGYYPQSEKDSEVWVYNLYGTDGYQYYVDEETQIYYKIEIIRWIIENIDKDGEATLFTQLILFNDKDIQIQSSYIFDYLSDEEIKIKTNILSKLNYIDITYELNGGVIDSNNNPNRLFDFEGDFNLNEEIEIIKKEYDFIGWFDELGEEIEIISFDSISPKKTIKLIAKWEKIFDIISIKTGTSSLYAKIGDYITIGKYPQSIKKGNVNVSNEPDENGYYIGSDTNYYVLLNDNYYKLEVVKWKIIDIDNNGVATLLSEKIIEGSNFSDSNNNYQDSILKNNIETLFETLFTPSQKELLDGDNPLYIFSDKDYSNENYQLHYKMARIKSITDYVKEIDSNITHYWTSSAAENNKVKAFNLINGETNFKDIDEYLGIVLALKIKITESLKSNFVVYELSGGQEPAEENTNIVYNFKDYYILNNPTKEGYEFLGWYNGIKISSNKLTRLEYQEGVSTIKLYAKWNYIGTYEFEEEDTTLLKPGMEIYFGEYPQTIKEESVNIDTSQYNEKGYYIGDDGNYYAKLNNNYYKVETLKWQLYDIYNDGKGLFVASKILYNDLFATKDLGTKNTYANSKISSFLNNTFFNRVFSDSQKDILESLEIDNISYSVFLPSIDDVKKLTEYIYKDSSDYSNAKEAVNYYWTRTITSGQVNVIELVDENLVDSTKNVISNNVGILPAIIIDISDYLEYTDYIFELNGGIETNSTSLIRIYSFDDEEKVLPSPSKPNSYFLQWYDNQYFNGSPITHVTFEESKKNEEIKLYAKWLTLYEVVDINNNKKTEANLGDYVYYGEYPQTLMKKGVEIYISSIDDRGYYKGSDGKYYAQVVNGEPYYFLVEPIKWKVISIDNGILTLSSELILDNIEYAIQNSEGVTNNYMTSYLKDYLEDTFLDNFVPDTLILNLLSPLYYTLPDSNVPNETNICIQLKEEIISSNITTKKVTDYSLAKGAIINPDTKYGSYWTRSYSSTNQFGEVEIMNDIGEFQTESYFNKSGVAPIISINTRYYGN